MGNSGLELSDYCIIDHWNTRHHEAGERITPLQIVRIIVYMVVDRKMHFTGLRGGLWKLLGIDRSTKNPNICNM